MSDADIERAVKNSYMELGHEDAGKLANTLNTLNKHGILGSLGGAVSVVGGFYQLFAKDGNLADEPLERLAIAKDFISFFGASQHFIKTGDKILGSGVADWMGLSKDVPAIWGKEGLWGKKIEESRPPTPQIDPIGGIEMDDFRDGMNNAIDEVFGRVPRPETPTSDNSDARDGIINVLGDDQARASGDTPRVPGTPSTSETPEIPPSTASRIAGTVVKTLSASADFFGGVADIVLGAHTIKSGVKNDSDLEKTAGSLQVIGGTLSGAAGGIGVASLFGPVGAAAAFTGPLFLAGVAIIGIAGIVGYFVDHEKKQKATDKEGDWYENLADIGLTQDDWGDKVEYARYSFYEYGRDAPDDQSIFDYQEKEWEYFKDTPEKNGSSNDRLNDKLHREYA